MDHCPENSCHPGADGQLPVLKRPIDPGYALAENGARSCEGAKACPAEFVLC
jgi:hypothetical protein